MYTVTQINRGNRRWYEAEGDERVAGLKLPSATTVLNKLDKPAIMPWYKKLVREQLGAYITSSGWTILTLM